VFRRILRVDQLAYFVFVDISGNRPSWQRLLVQRVVASVTDGQRLFGFEEMLQRMRFVTPEDHTRAIEVLHVAHVVFDPFPVGGGSYHPSLEALAIGVPVITLPTPILSGRLTLALYRIMGLDRADSFQNSSSLIVSTINEYVTVALQITHQPLLRSHYCSLILQQRYKLFQNRSERVFREWRDFAMSAVVNASRDQ